MINYHMVDHKVDGVTNYKQPLCILNIQNLTEQLITVESKICFAVLSVLNKF